MCISAAVIAGASLAVAAVGTVAAIDSANYQAGMAELQLQEQRERFRKEQQMLRLQGQEEELARIRDFEARRQRNLAAIAGQTGFGQNISFFQGADKAAEDALKKDLTNLRLNTLGQVNRVSGQLRGTQYASTLNQASRKSAVVGSLLNFASSAIGTASFYDQFKTPPSTPPTSGGGGGGWYPQGGR